MRLVYVSIVLLAVTALALASEEGDKIKKLEKELKKLKEAKDSDAIKQLEKEVKKLAEAAKKAKKEKEEKKKAKEAKKVKDKRKKMKSKSHDDDKLYCYCGEKMSEQFERCDTFYDQDRYTCFKVVDGNRTVRRGAMNADRCSDAEAISQLVKDNFTPLKGLKPDVHLHCCHHDYCNSVEMKRFSPLLLAAVLPLAYFGLPFGY